VISERYWNYQKETIAGINIDESIKQDPKEYPCIAIVTYSGAGFDEIDFVYLSDFAGIK